MDAAIWGLLGTVVGALASIGTTWIAGHHAFSLQRQATSDEQAERHRAFQLETLIQLQETLHDSLRMTTRAHMEDVASFKKSGEWGRSLLSEEVNEGVRVSARRTSILIQRVADDALRSNLRRLVEEMGHVLKVKSSAEADAALVRAFQTGDTVMEHIGTVLRSLYRSK